MFSLIKIILIILIFLIYFAELMNIVVFFFDDYLPFSGTYLLRVDIFDPGYERIEIFLFIIVFDLWQERR